MEFVGYGGGRGLPHEHLLWASDGPFVMDTRAGHDVLGARPPDPVGGAPNGP
ncbi:acetylxylan esterase [Streptomyces sp. DHE17-7]|uniref:acetylxylan esterase n=1 Tax=Streptomyces sp. DHE17-7 TaxID=2759949 RepID=UPI003FA6EBD0